jgi:asparagine synthase (glutamine-hydrolysing)
MRGICGIVFHDRNRHVTEAHLAPLLKALALQAEGEGRSRCRNAAGVGGHAASGHLSAIDEVTIDRRSFLLSFSGDLYNLKELFPTAEQNGRTLGEKLVTLYLKEGVMFLRRLRGEFALALWDQNEETLLLAVDRFRVSPLFYYLDQEKIVFASRLPAILACSLPIQRTLHPEAIIEVAASSVIPTPKTIFREIHKLPPGHVLLCREGKVQLESYWDITFLHPDRRSEIDLARELKVYFSDAMLQRLQIEKSPDLIGTFLSGGVDSSTVTGVLTQLLGRPTKSFSIGFGEQKFNEISYARIAAQAFGAEHYEYFVTPQDTLEAIPILLENFDEPFANASAIPTYFCARLARQHGVDVLYAGDGGDELFAGNERYATQRLFEYYDKIPSWLGNSAVKPLVSLLAESTGHNLFVKGKKYIQRASIPYPDRLSSYGFFSIVPLRDFLTDDFVTQVEGSYNPAAALNALYYHAQAKQELDRQLYVDLKLTISDNDLFKVTRMTEAAGVMVRFPFLDHHLAEFAATIPADLKMPGRELRAFFKRAYADLLPLETRTKTKHGFGLPIPVWLRTDTKLSEMMRDVILSSRSMQRGYFRPQMLQEMVQRHATDTTSFYGTILWNLMILELWLRKYYDGER